MLRLFDERKQVVPILAWLQDPEQLDATCRQQAENLASLPFAFRHVALMPDTHGGFGMPIGGVLACEDILIPNAVGVDIGCGVAFARTNIPAKVLGEVQTSQGTLAQAMVSGIMRQIPTGFEHHQSRQPCRTLDAVQGQVQAKGDLPDLEEGYYQVGTLGGGNHFIELQEDQEGKLGIMVHSGSRNFGYKTARHFNQRAKAMAGDLRYEVPPAYDLAYLPANSSDGQRYRRWLQLCLDFAKENRERMMRITQQVVADALKRYAKLDMDVTLEVQAHHNYAVLEEHFGREVWVHRKGAIAANKGQWGLIPGAMGSYSYVTKGLGNPDSFCSCSHGAGRAMGRKEALRSFSTEEVMQDLKRRGVVLGKIKKKDTAEEYRLAYKNIEDVMALQEDLMEPIWKLMTKAVVKG